MMFACSHGHDPVVRLLFEHGADASAKNKEGETALHVAARTGHLGVMAECSCRRCPPQGCRRTIILLLIA